MAKSPEEYAHLEWLGYVQPVGLVVSVPAMLQAQCYINKNIIEEHARFLALQRTLGPRPRYTVVSIDHRHQILGFQC